MFGISYHIFVVIDKYIISKDDNNLIEERTYINAIHYIKIFLFLNHLPKNFLNVSKT